MNQENINTHHIEEDEIDLRELFRTILAGKWIIITIAFIVVSLTLVYALKQPNEYKSEAILIPIEQASSGLGGLGGLAAMAGVSLGGGGSMTPDVAFNSLLNNYEFMKNFVIKNKIVEYYSSEDLDKNYFFALGYRGIYDFFKSDKEEEEVKNFDDEVFKTIKSVRGNFSIAADKKSSLITVSYNDKDRTYPPKMIDAFLRDASKYLVENNLRIIDNKLGYFEKELLQTEGFELRQNISAIISKILEEKIMMQSKTYYQCDVLTLPSESYIKDKTKPKRGLILVVSFVTSIILGIFFVFLLAFIRGDSPDKTKI